MKTIHDLAALINGRQYGDETTPDIENIASNNNWLIVFGASDDLMEWRGAISDEFGSWEGAIFNLRVAKFGHSWDVYNRDMDTGRKDRKDKFRDTPRNLKLKADWCPENTKGNPSWVFKHKQYPCAKFEIIDGRDGATDLYCIGLVIDLNPLLA